MAARRFGSVRRGVPIVISVYLPCSGSNFVLMIFAAIRPIIGWKMFTVSQSCSSDQSCPNTPGASAAETATLDWIDCE